MLGFRPKRRLQEYYQITGFISSGTYGRVYKAKGVENGGVFAIKRFKPDREGEPAYTGISQSATREMALCAELRHANVIEHVETFLQDKSIIMVFSYCEHDLLQIIHHHSQQVSKTPIPPITVRSVLYQLLKGCQYLHENWVMHRDLKPANIMVNSSGRVMIGDLGLARIFRAPKTMLYAGDKVVVTIWYRAPELLLGARHYTPAIDLWAVGCIFAELLALRPIFKGEEVKPDNRAGIDAKKQVPFQSHQMRKIVEILGMPETSAWADLPAHPDYGTFAAHFGPGKVGRPVTLQKWYASQTSAARFPGLAEGKAALLARSPGAEGLELLQSLLTWDPEQRVSAETALAHPYFDELHADLGVPRDNCFEGAGVTYPRRKITQEDNQASLPGTKRGGLPDDSLGSGRPAKRLKEF